MTYDEAKIEIVRTSTTWAEVEDRWHALNRALAWFHGHRWVITPGEVFHGASRRKSWPPDELGGVDDPMGNVERIVDLANRYAYRPQWQFMTLD